MRKLNVLRVAAVLGAAAAVLNAAAAPVAQETFDACNVFTPEDAEAALGVAASGEPVNPKVKRPKVIPVCTYNGFKEGKPVAATVQFRFGKTDADAKGAFDDESMKIRTKPLLISGTEAAYWSAKTGQMHVRKGRTWLTVTVGPPKLSERDMDDARKLAEILVKKL